MSLAVGDEHPNDDILTGSLRSAAIMESTSQPTWLRFALIQEAKRDGAELFIEHLT